MEGMSNLNRELLMAAGFRSPCTNTILREGKGHSATVPSWYIEGRLEAFWEYTFESVVTPCAELRDLSILHLPTLCHSSAYGLGHLKDASLVERARERAERAAENAKFHAEFFAAKFHAEEEEEEEEEEEREEPTVESLLEKLNSTRAELERQREPKSVPGGLLSAFYEWALQSPEGHVGYAVARELESMAARAISLSARELNPFQEVLYTILQKRLRIAEKYIERDEEELQAVREGRWKEWNKAQEEGW